MPRGGVRTDGAAVVGHACSWFCLLAEEGDVRFEDRRGGIDDDRTKFLFQDTRFTLVRCTIGVEVAHRMRNRLAGAMEKDLGRMHVQLGF